MDITLFRLAGLGVPPELLTRTTTLTQESRRLLHDPAGPCLPGRRWRRKVQIHQALIGNGTTCGCATTIAEEHPAQRHLVTLVFYLAQAHTAHDRDVQSLVRQYNIINSHLRQMGDFQDKILEEAPELDVFLTNVQKILEHRSGRYHQKIIADTSRAELLAELGGIGDEKPTTLVAIHGDRYWSYEVSIYSQVWEGDDSGETWLFHVPALIAAKLQTQAQAGGQDHSEGEIFFAPSQVEDTPEVFEVLQGLWNPYDRGVTQTLQGALDVARKLTTC